MRGVMAGMTELWSAMVRIRRAHFNHVLLDDVALLMMEVAIMEIVDVIAVFDRDMAAARTMAIRVVGVNVRMSRH